MVGFAADSLVIRRSSSIRSPVRLTFDSEVVISAASFAVVAGALAEAIAEIEVVVSHPARISVIDVMGG